MSFTDGKPWVVTEAQTKLAWGGGFHCRLCGHDFKAGDTARWIFANFTGSPSHYGNFLVCTACDKGNEETLRLAGEQENTLRGLLKTMGRDL
jgi:hypothetical protein